MKWQCQCKRPENERRELRQSLAAVGRAGGGLRSLARPRASTARPMPDRARPANRHPPRPEGSTLPADTVRHARLGNCADAPAPRAAPRPVVHRPPPAPSQGRAPWGSPSDHCRQGKAAGARRRAVASPRPSVWPSRPATTARARPRDFAPRTTPRPARDTKRRPDDRADRSNHCRSLHGTKAPARPLPA